MITVIAHDRAGARHEVQARPGESLMEALKHRGGLDIAAICGGSCSCATCHVHVDAGWAGRLDPPEPDEIEIVEFAPGYCDTSRLSCQIRVTEALDGLCVTLAPES